MCVGGCVWVCVGGGVAGMLLSAYMQILGYFPIKHNVQQYYWVGLNLINEINTPNGHTAQCPSWGRSVCSLEVEVYKEKSSTLMFGNWGGGIPGNPLYETLGEVYKPGGGVS